MGAVVHCCRPLRLRHRIGTSPAVVVICARRASFLPRALASSLPIYYPFAKGNAEQRRRAAVGADGESQNIFFLLSQNLRCLFRRAPLLSGWVLQT